MDMSVEDRFELEKRNDNRTDFHSASTVSLDWRFNGTGIANSSMGLVLPACRDLVGGSSCTSVVDSVGPAMWEQSTSSQDMGFCDFDVQKNVSTSSTTEIGKADPSSLISGISRPLDMGWNPPNSALKSDVFLSNASGMLPQSLPQVPADLAFIERAARFSCFGAENSGDMINCFATPASMFLYSSEVEMTQSQEVFGSRGLKSVSSGQDQQNATNVGVPSKDVLLSVGQMASEGSPIKNHRRSESIVRSHDEAKQVVGDSGNESDEAEYSGGYGQDEQSMLKGDERGTTAKNPVSKKRRRSGQDAESNQADGTQKPGEATKGNIEIQQRGDQKPISTANKITRRQGKQGYQASDPPKEDYIHVRARRGQATNSHSLAERVRREKISERMKFLQDLVPGCSKVTGKAVMLDEIINYVQSLQRQVEFLSMKLATVNPRLDFNIEGLLAKDFLQSHTVPPSLAFAPEMPMAYPPLPSTQPGLVPAAFPGLESHSDILRRTINSQMTTITGEFKEPTQITNAWDDELHNVVQMSYASGAPQDPQPVNGMELVHLLHKPLLCYRANCCEAECQVVKSFAGSMPSGQLKIEL